MLLLKDIFLKKPGNKLVKNRSLMRKMTRYYQFVFTYKKSIYVNAHRSALFCASQIDRKIEDCIVSVFVPHI